MPTTALCSKGGSIGTGLLTNAFWRLSSEELVLQRERGREQRGREERYLTVQETSDGRGESRPSRTTSRHAARASRGQGQGRLYREGWVIFEFYLLY